jgi:lactate dehydrogenase (NAD+,ferredoxin) subunit LctD
MRYYDITFTFLMQPPPACYNTPMTSQRPYGVISPEIIAELKRIPGEITVISEAEKLADYDADETPGGVRHLPETAVIPTSPEQVAAILNIANRHHIPVTPRGGGTGLAGGCVPLYGGILLVMTGLNKIISVNNHNFTAVVEPGVTLGELTEKLDGCGLTYPVHPGEMTATIGGTVATNAGGMNAVKHGVTRHHVLGLEAFTARGEFIRCGGAYVKSSSGYDFTQLITGSEGTLAIITRIILKLGTVATLREILFVPFPNMENAIDAVPDILRLEMQPSGLEFMEKDILDIVTRHTGQDIPRGDHDAYLMIIVDAADSDELHRYFVAAEAICHRHGGGTATAPGDARARRRLLNARENFLPALRAMGELDVIDIVVPRHEIPVFLRQVKALSATAGIPVIAYGHAGDGNIHLHPVRHNISREHWQAHLPQLEHDIFTAGIALGGAVSGEHGIGIGKKHFLPLQHGEASLDIMRRIKLALDPDNILNPGKIFDL